MLKYTNINSRQEMNYKKNIENGLFGNELKEVVKTAEDDGRKKEKAEIAQKLKSMGFTKEQRMEATGLSDDEN